MIHRSDPTRAYVPNVAKLERENILGLKWQHNTPIQRLWRENITEHTQVLDL